VTTDHGENELALLPACPDCGTDATPGGRFCRVCGAPLDATEPGRGRPFPAGGVRATEAEDDETTGELPQMSRDTAAALTDQAGMPMRSCKNCGAPNSSRRELCGRCGADLDTGELTARPDPRPYTQRPAAEAEPDRARRWAAPVVAVLGVAALVLIGLALAGLGPFDRGPTLADVAFDEDRYTDEPSRLPLANIATLSALPDQGSESFAPTQMVDDDPSTAWNSDGGGGGPEQGIGERIDIDLAEPAWIQRVVVANGDQRDPDTYAANARVRRAQLTLDGGITFVVNLLDEGISEQAVDLRQPVLTTSLRLEVLDVFEGDTHPDLAISDLAFEGWAADGEDAAVAQSRAEARAATRSTR
jgi:uncharacterized OB-fold protein